MEDRLINDFACIDPIYVDGLFTEGVVSLGTNFATPYFRYTPTMRDGSLILERTPALYVIRPIASLDPRDLLAMLLKRQQTPTRTVSAMH